MKILLIGASGNIGIRITKEALERGHEVIALQRNPEKLSLRHPKLTIEAGDALQPQSWKKWLDSCDLVVSSLPTLGSLSVPEFKLANQELIEMLSRTPAKRLLIVGGAGSTEVRPGIKMFESPLMDQFPDAWKPAVWSHWEVLKLYQSSPLNWTYFSPAYLIDAGERTGKYRLGGTNMIFDDKGVSFISYEDYAMALVDEIDHPRHLRQQFTIGY